VRWRFCGGYVLGLVGRKVDEDMDLLDGYLKKKRKIRRLKFKKMEPNLKIFSIKRIF